MGREPTFGILEAYSCHNDYKRCSIHIGVHAEAECGHCNQGRYLFDCGRRRGTYVYAICHICDMVSLEFNSSGSCVYWDDDWVLRSGHSVSGVFKCAQPLYCAHAHVEERNKKVLQYTKYNWMGKEKKNRDLQSAYNKTGVPIPGMTFRTSRFCGRTSVERANRSASAVC